MPELYVDTATTGLWAFGKPHDAPEQPHMVRIAWMRDDDVPVCLLIRPMAGWRIDDESRERHGVSMTDCQTLGWELGRVLDHFTAEVLKSDRIIAFNWEFHKRILERAAAEAGHPAIPWPVASCAMRAATPIVKKPRQSPGGGFVFPKFGEAYRFFTGEEMPTHSDPIERGALMIASLGKIWAGIQAETA